MSVYTSEVETQDYMVGDLLVEEARVLPPSEEKKRQARDMLLTMLKEAKREAGNEEKSN